MSKIPSMSSKQFIKLLEKGGATFVRQKRTDHAIYSRYYNDRRYSAPVLTGKKTLDPNYCKRVFSFHPEIAFLRRPTSSKC